MYRNALQGALNEGHEAIVKLLIENRAQINIMAMSDAPRVLGNQHMAE